MRMALLAYGGVLAFVGLALFDRYPISGGMTVFFGVPLAALGHTGVDGRGNDHESG